MSNPIQRGNHNAFSEGQNLYVLYEVDEAQINLGNFEEKNFIQTSTQAVVLNDPRLVILSHRRAGREIGEVVLTGGNFKICFQ